MRDRLRIGVIHSRVRVEEKWIFAALENRRVEFDRLDDRKFRFDLQNPEDWIKYDAVILRSISHNRGLYAARMLNTWGVPTINSASVGEICGDKVATTTILAKAGIPQPRTKIAFTPQAALDAIESIGYPVVIKPVVGSWGRLLAKLNDRDAAEAVLEHKSILGSYHHSIFYIQEYIDKPGRDIRVSIIGDEVIFAMYRISEHWLTNTAKGALGKKCEVSPELEEISLKAAEAVGGGVLAIDIIEHPDRGLVLNEINHTMEFHTVQPTSGIDIAGLYVDYAIKVAKRKIRDGET